MTATPRPFVRTRHRPRGGLSPARRVVVLVTALVVEGWQLITLVEHVRR